MSKEYVSFVARQEDLPLIEVVTGEICDIELKQPDRVCTQYVHVNGQTTSGDELDQVIQIFPLMDYKRGEAVTELNRE